MILFYLPLNTVITSLISPVDSTLQANLLSLAMFSLLFFGWAKLRPAEVGWRWNEFLAAEEKAYAA